MQDWEGGRGTGARLGCTKYNGGGGARLGGWKGGLEQDWGTKYNGRGGGGCKTWVNSVTEYG